MLRLFLCLRNQRSCSIFDLSLNRAESCSVYQASEVYADWACPGIKLILVQGLGAFSARRKKITDPHWLYYWEPFKAHINAHIKRTPPGGLLQLHDVFIQSNPVHSQSSSLTLTIWLMIAKHVRLYSVNGKIMCLFHFSLHHRHDFHYYSLKYGFLFPLSYVVSGDSTKTLNHYS